MLKCDLYYVNPANSLENSFFLVSENNGSRLTTAPVVGICSLILGADRIKLKKKCEDIARKELIH